MSLKYHIYDAYLKVLSRKELKYFKILRANNNRSFEDLENEKFIKAKLFLEYCSENVPYYINKFREMGFSPHDMQSLDDLQRLPILTKKEILANYNDIIPGIRSKGAVYGSTGGSTGDPLKYYLSKSDYEMGIALMYRGWNYAGYMPGDKVLIFAGSSIVGKETLTSKINKYFRNLKSVSSYGVSEKEIKEVVDVIRNWRPKYLRGYASSLTFLAEYILHNNIISDDFKSLHGIFSTAEMLSPASRNLIESAFKCTVFNQYGLNDGGISAFENPTLTNGFLIDSERAIFESVDENGLNALNRMGEFVATSYLNFDFPLIRYSTGDTGVISDSYIKRGGNRFIITELNGRVTDFIEINKKKIASPVLTVLMGKVDVLRYQIVQRSAKIEMLILKGPNYDEKSEQYIKQSLTEHLGPFSLSFNYSGDFIKSNNKHKFIIRMNDED